MLISKEELLRLANIFDNAGQVFFAGLVISPMFLPLVQTSLPVIMINGLILAISSWYASLKITKLTIQL